MDEISKKALHQTLAWCCKLAFVIIILFSLLIGAYGIVLIGILGFASAIAITILDGIKKEEEKEDLKPFSCQAPPTLLPKRRRGNLVKGKSGIRPTRAKKNDGK